MNKKLFTSIIGIFCTLSAFSTNHFVEQMARKFSFKMHKAPASCVVITNNDTISVSYNKNGEPTSIVVKMGDEVDSETTVEYRPNGDEKVTVKNGGQVYVEGLKAKAKFTFTTTYTGSNGKTVATYNTHGDITREQTYRNGQLKRDQLFTYTYDNKGHKLKRNFLNEKYNETYTYHENGNLKTVKGTDNGKTDYTAEHNTYGDMTKFVEFDKSGTATRIEEMTYTYDNNGNWTKASKKTTFPKKGGITVSTDFERIITY